MDSRKKVVFVTRNEARLLLLFSLFVVTAIAMLFIASQQDHINGINDIGIIVWAALFGGIPFLMIIHYVRKILERAKARRFGVLYQAKIIDYEVDFSMRINGKPVKDLQVAFFKNGMPRRSAP